MRWIVGDLQGCARELEDLLRTIDFDPGRDELWCAGDMINRGPDTLATLRLWRDVQGRSVIGNHEIYALCAHSGRWPRKPDTLEQFYAAPEVESLLDQLRRLPLLTHLRSDGDGPDAWLVHGGVHPGWNLDDVAQRMNPGPHDDDWLESPEVSFATRVRCCTPEGERCKWDGAPEQCPPPCRAWDELWSGNTLIVHGHWARRGYYRSPHSLGLDSGCVYGGMLTAWCQDEDRIVQVPAHA